MTVTRLRGDRIAAVALAVIVHVCSALGDCTLREFGRTAPSRVEEAIAIDCGFVFLILAFAVFCIPLIYDHPFRVCGWVPPVAAASLSAWWIDPVNDRWLWIVFAALQGIAFGGSAGIVFAILRPAVFRLVWAVLGLLVLGLWFISLDWLRAVVGEPGRYRSVSIPVLAFVLVVSALVFLRPLVELGFELPTRICCRIRGRGPGLASFPARGPVIVLANHASYMDPLFLAGDVPRPITPMMTSKFYDRLLIYPFVRFVFGVIRVPDVNVRRSAPELDLAVKALDRGRCLVIFPEGFLQRKPDPPLRRFGRGVWEILKSRPDTPVIAAWIEGSWGSFFSYANGPPTKGKKPDFRRPVDVGYSASFTMPRELLDDHWAARFYLMNKVGEARGLLGLPRVPEMELPEKDKDNQRGAEDTEDSQRNP